MFKVGSNSGIDAHDGDGGGLNRGRINYDYRFTVHCMQAHKQRSTITLISSKVKMRVLRH